MTLTALGFDADDTLWHNESLFRLTQDRFAALLSDHADPADIAARMLEAETRNLAFYGYGVKGFTLSMIETATEIGGDGMPASVIQDILGFGREMLTQPVDCLPGVVDTLRALAGDYTLVLITKGDLFDQERKLAQSGLGGLFDRVEIVSEKSPATYRAAFAGHAPGAAMMIGNSLKSDVIPALEAGAWGVHVPYHVTWELELADAPETHPKFRRLTGLAELPALLSTLQAAPELSSTETAT